MLGLVVVYLTTKAIKLQALLQPTRSKAVVASLFYTTGYPVAVNVLDVEMDNVAESISRPISAAAFKASSISRACCSMTMSISSRAAKSRRRYTSVRLTPANMMNRVARSLGSSNVAAKPCCSSSLHELRAVMLRRGERHGARHGARAAGTIAGLGSRGWGRGAGRSVPRAVRRLRFEGLQFGCRGCGAQVGRSDQADQSEGACANSAEDGCEGEACEDGLVEVAVERVVHVLARFSGGGRQAPGIERGEHARHQPQQRTAVSSRARQEAQHGPEDQPNEQIAVHQVDADAGRAVEAVLRRSVVPPQAKSKDRRHRPEDQQD